VSRIKRREKKDFFIHSLHLSSKQLIFATGEARPPLSAAEGA